MNIIFDLDSTLATIEGIDELGALKNLQQEITALTNQAMNGAIPFESVFEKRLEMIQPTRPDLEQIAQLYLQHTTPHAQEVVQALIQAGHTPFIVTGGYEICTTPLAQALNIEHVHANRLFFDKQGKYAGLDSTIPLWKTTGKAEIVRKIRQNHPGRTLMIGDGATDARAGADTFIYFGGVVLRPEVAAMSEYEITDLRELLEIV